MSGCRWTKLGVGLFMAAVMTAGCARLRTHVTVAGDVSPAQYASYVWASPAGETIGDPPMSPAMLEAEVVARVDEGLRGLGYRRAAAAPAPLRVAYVMEVKQQAVPVADRHQGEDNIQPAMKWSRGSGWGPVTAEDMPATEVFDVGTLTLTLTDAARNTTVWEACTELTISRALEESQKKQEIAQAAHRILRRL